MDLYTQFQKPYIERLAAPLRRIIIKDYLDGGYNFEFVSDMGREGLNKFKHHKQAALNLFRYPPDIVRHGFYHSYALSMHTPPGDNHEAWARYSEGGLVIPEDAEYFLMGGVVALRAYAESFISHFVVGFDHQVGGDRCWARIRAQVSDGESNIVDRVQYSSTGTNTPVWVNATDVDGNAISFGSIWNEPKKPMFLPIAFLFHKPTRKIKRIHVNTNTYETDLQVSLGETVAGFDYGGVPMFWFGNFPASATQSGAAGDALVESPFLAIAS